MFLGVEKGIPYIQADHIVRLPGLLNVIPFHYIRYNGVKTWILEACQFSASQYVPNESLKEQEEEKINKSELKALYLY